MRIFYLLLTTLGCLRAAAQLPAVAQLPATDQSLEFVPNQGQWPSAVRYAAAVPGGHLCLEPDGLRYVLLAPIAHPHAETGHEGGGKTTAPTLPDAGSTVQGHQLRVAFVGADAATPLEPSTPTGGRRNYLHGSDPAHWASDVPGYRQVRYQAPWPGVGAHFYENETQHLEYDFEVAAGADANRVQLRYEGATSLRLSDDGQLHVETSVGELTELHPQAYQLDPRTGERQPVACRYVLQASEATVSFRLGRYDHGRPLVIDPTVQFSTYSGARGSNWGFTATYDAAGNMYSGGIVLDDMNAAVSYPTTTGAFQTTFGGVIDMAFIKYNTSVNGAASRVWATYVGGNQADFPSSLVVNTQGELVILGSTASSNYPTTRGAVQRSFRGGTPAKPFGDDGPFYTVGQGTDIVVTRLAANGSTLAASTYLGGTANDGLVAFNPTSAVRQLPQNYGDDLRGDIITDAQGNIYLASTTSSGDFPVTAGSFSSTYRGGTCDGVVVKLPADLTALTWSGYLGGSAADAAYSLQLDATGNVYVAGGTLSGNFPATAGAASTTAQGDVDGFVARIAANGSSIQRATYLGTSAYDQTFFVQLGADGGVYLLGQSLGAWPVTAGVYSNPGSHQYIQKLSADLDQRLLSTVFGSGRATLDISPTAFLVDQCDRVYACGWGGNVNQNVYNIGAASQNGYTDGMAVTTNAVRATPDTPGQGSDFYLAQFAPGLTALTYGTYYGDATAGSTGDHVDGGTSRFDPRGVVYAAVCSCFNYSGFPVPPGAYTYSPVNGSANASGTPLCNNAAFKLNFEPTAVSVGLNQTVCSNAPAIALRGSPSGGIWTGPGITGSVATGFVFTPSVALVGAQTLTYTLLGATQACTVTGQQVITVTPVQTATLAPLPQSVYCLQAGTPAPTVVLQGSPAGGTYAGPGVSGNVFSPSAAGNGAYTLTYTVGAGTPCPSTASVQVSVIGSSAGAGFSVCATSGPVRLSGGSPAGGVWSGPGVTGSVSTGFFFTPNAASGLTQTLTYSVASATGTCTASATVQVVLDVPPVATAPALPAVCAGSGPVALVGTPAGGVWTGPGVSAGPTAGTYVFTPTNALAGTQTLTYTVKGNLSCATFSDQATTTVQVLPTLTVRLPADSVLCPGSTQAFRLAATPAGGVWSGPGISQGNLFTPVLGTSVLTYTVDQGTPCPVSATRRITLLAEPTLSVTTADIACRPAAVAPLLVHYTTGAVLSGGATLTWDFGDNTPPITGFDVTHTYTQAGTFRAQVTLSYNQGRCQKLLDLPPVTVQAMFIPNIITPNGDQQNETFAPRIGGCAPRLQVFSRWGQQVYDDKAYQNTWNAPGLAAGLYYYLLTPTDNLPVQKGWVEVVR